MHNVSTQFADGGEFGFGGEIGISTTSFHPEDRWYKPINFYKYLFPAKELYDHN